MVNTAHPPDLELHSKTRSVLLVSNAYSGFFSKQSNRIEIMNKQTEASPAATSSNDPRWAAVVARDPDADGKFVYAVRTTGVYCRPSCRSRLAKAENVAFYASAAAAASAGFRPCKRCRPDLAGAMTPHMATIAELCRFIASAEKPPTLAELSAHARISAYHLHRLFKAATGLTPSAYARAERARRVRQELERCTTVTAAIYDAGYQSSGRFYAEAKQLLGMTPARYRAGGAQTVIRFALGECSLGSLLVAQSERGICAIALGDDPLQLANDLHDRFPAATLNSGDADFAQLVARVIAFVEAPKTGLDLPLDIRGTLFQQRVWHALREIPAGQTASYSELAQRIGAPRAVRAVAGACAANSLAVVIPCHRVVRNDGSLSGYRWGIERKAALLEREGGESDSHQTGS